MIDAKKCCVLTVLTFYLLILNYYSSVGFHTTLLVLQLGKQRLFIAGMHTIFFSRFLSATVLRDCKRTVLTKRKYQMTHGRVVALVARERIAEVSKLKTRCIIYWNCVKKGRKTLLANNETTDRMELRTKLEFNKSNKGFLYTSDYWMPQQWGLTPSG